MNLYLDAKHHYQALISVLDLDCLAKPFCTAFSGMLERHTSLVELFNEFFAEGYETKPLPRIEKDTYLLIEDCALAIADYLLATTSIGEFEIAITMEDVRQALLPKIIEANPHLKDIFYEKEASFLRRNTPKNL